MKKDWITGDINFVDVCNRVLADLYNALCQSLKDREVTKEEEAEVILAALSCFTHVALAKVDPEDPEGILDYFCQGLPDFPVVGKEYIEYGAPNFPKGRMPHVRKLGK